jgi:hypothetical protein
MLFAHLKRILGLGKLRLRGPSGAKDEFLLAATAQNLRKLAKLIPLPEPSRDDQFTPYQTVIGSKAAADRRDTHRVEGNPDGDAATFGAVRARAPA